MPKESQNWFVYILSCQDQSLYTGIARDVAKRISTHNLGKGAKYTASRLPVKLAYQEPATSRSEALKREHQIKSLSRAEKIQLIASDNYAIPLSS